MSKKLLCLMGIVILLGLSTIVAADAPVTEEFGDAAGTDHPGTIEDTTANAGYGGDDNFSTDVILNTYTWPANTIVNTIIIKWDLSAIPTGATVTEATLHLYQVSSDRDATYDIGVHKIINFNPVISALTWQTYNGTNGWTGGATGGLNDIAAAEDIQAVNRTDNEYKTWSVTGMVQDWVSAPLSNYGMLVNSDDIASSDSCRFFASTEDSDTAIRPKLIVTYYIGEIPPGQATNPSPSHLATDVVPDVKINWTAGEGVDSHDIYLGTIFDDVNDANNTLPVGTSVYKGNQSIDANSYDPGVLASQQVYYWRIDEVNESEPNIWKGSIWRFTVKEYTPGDFTDDGVINNDDVGMLADEWLDMGPDVVADADFDDKVDFNDYAILANGWVPPPPPPTNECGNWQVLHPEWIFCDDFEDDTAMVRDGRYFEYDNNGGDFVPLEGLGVDGSKGMRVRFQAGEVSAGNFKLGFGRNPSGGMNRGIRENEDFREIYYRMYLKMQDGWTGNPMKLSRATSFSSSTDWSQAMIAHIWEGGAYSLGTDPVRCVDPNSQVKCIGYNNFPNMDWIGHQNGITPVFDSVHDGIWYCVEAHVKLNDPGYSNGVHEFWIDGQLEARGDNLNFVRSYTDYAINAIFFENYWNGGSTQLQERYFDNIVVSTQPIGCLD